MLNQQHALTKLRAEIEGQEGRVCWRYKRFRHLACNCRNKKKEEEERKPILQNKFEVIVSRVIQCGVGEEVKVRRQETMEEVKYFRCWGVRHLKWECPNIEVKKKKRREKEAAHVARPQKAQQERRLACPIWEKVQEYCGEWNAPLEGALLLERGWIMREVVAIYVDCGGCEDKGVQTYENQGQGFLLEKQVRNMWCSSCQEAWN